MITLPKDVESELDSAASPSSTRVPFRQSDNDTDPLLVETDLPPPFEPPPSFSPYKASYFEVGYEEICSHDPHLNFDGEALYRFLIERSQRPPFVRVNIRGTHTEHRTRWVTHRDNDGRTHQKSETYTETITDFDFCLDIVPPQGTKPVQWSIPDKEPAYRGKMVKEVEEVALPSLGSIRRSKRRARRKEVQYRKQWNDERRGRGLPPWTTPEDIEHLIEAGEGSSLLGSNPLASLSRPYVENLANIERHSLRSTKTLRQWADEYCRSPKHLKEFVYDQYLYGWNMSQIESAIRSTVTATPYNGTLGITFTKYRSRIYIRPNNRLSKFLSNKWLVFLSIILFVYPFIWLFKRFHSQGGGKWQVCGAGYPMKKWVPVTEDGEPLPADTDEQGLPTLPPYVQDEDAGHTQASFSRPTSPQMYSRSISGNAPLLQTSPSSSSRLIQTSTGPKKLEGIREGEWFRRWGDAITRAVVVRHQSSTPLQDPEYTMDAVRELDGYCA